MTRQDTIESNEKICFSIRKKLVILCICLVTLPALVLGTLIYQTLKKQAYRHTIRELELVVSDWETISKIHIEQISRVLKREEILVEQRLKSIGTAVHAILDSWARGNLSREEAFNIISAVRISKNGHVMILSPDGDILFSGGRLDDGKNIFTLNAPLSDFGRQIFSSMATLKKGHTITLKHRCQDTGNSALRNVLSVISHHSPLDIIVCINIYESDYKSTRFEQQLKRDLRFLMGEKKVKENASLFAINTKGEYVVSKDNLRDGENIMDEPTREGNHIIKEIIRKNVASGGKEFFTFQYSWKNIRDGKYHDRIAVTKYIPEWDWIIGASMLHEEFLSLLTLLRNYICFICTGAIIMGSLIALFISNLLATPLQYLEKITRKAARGELGMTIDRSIVSSKDEIGSLADSFDKMIKSLRERTETLYREKQALRESEQRFREIIENASDIIFTMDLNGVIHDISRSWQTLLGYDKLDIQGRHYNSYIHADDREKTKNGLKKLLSTEQPISIEYRIWDRYRNLQWHTCNATLLKDENDHPLYIIGIARDITEQKQKFDQMQSEAERDPLTTIFNRRMLEHFLESEVSKSKRYNSVFSVMMLDLDHFKQVNDTHGHDTGDMVLKKSTRIFKSMIREADILARYGGEEFVLLAPNTELDKALILSEKIRDVYSQTVFDKVGHLTLSIGVAQFRKNDTKESLFKRADTALYRAKQTGRNRVVSVE